jgi:hypothetical protein
MGEQGSMTIEYRRIGRLPTCIGNERIRIAADSEVSYSRNIVECEADATWSAPWRTVGSLEAGALTRLTQQIIDTGILGLEPESIDEAEGGTREEMDIAIGERECHFVAENADPPPFRAVVKLLWGVMFELGF